MNLTYSRLASPHSPPSSMNKVSALTATPRLLMRGAMMLVLGLLLSLGIFAAGALASQDSPLSLIAPDSVAACGATGLDGVMEKWMGDNEYGEADALSGYSNTSVRVSITVCEGDSIWSLPYKYQGFGETSSAVEWDYMGNDASPTACEFSANSRTSYRGYLFTAQAVATSATACDEGPEVSKRLPTTYDQGLNGGIFKVVSCTNYATPFAGYVNQDKPTSSCDSSSPGAGIDLGEIFYDTVAPTAPTWSTSSNANTFRNGNTLFFRPLPNSFDITLSHTEEPTSTTSGGGSYSWAALGSTTGWTYTPGDVLSSTTSTKTFSTTSTAVSTTVSLDSNDRASNDGANLTITLTRDATPVVVDFSAPNENTKTNTTDTTPTFTWTETDGTGSGIATQVGTIQTAPITSPNVCSTTWTDTAETVDSPTTTYTSGTLAAGACYRLKLVTVDNVGVLATRLSGSYLLDTSNPAAPTVTDNTASLTTASRNGDTIYFNNNVAGSVILTATAVDDESGILNHTFQPPSGNVTVGGNPADYTYNWAIDQEAFDLPIYATNNIALTSDTTVIHFVPKLEQTITFAALADKAYGDAAFTVSATASSGLSVTFTANGDCSLDGTQVTITGAGSCTITAMQAGSDDFLAAADVERTFTISKGTPLITWPDPASINYGTVLSATQLNASTPVAGIFTYAPEAGTLLPAGTHTLSTSFVPTDTDNYNSANDEAEIEVIFVYPPLEIGARNWTFIDDITHFDTGVVVVSDPTAPSGDGKVALLNSGSGEETVASEHVAIVDGEEVRVWGYWRLSGHGANLQLCFDVGGCTTNELIGDLGGSTVYSIDWITFEVSSIVPTGASEAWLEWTVASDSYADGFSWNILADGDSGNTIVDVNPVISITAPAMIDFGVGVPGDALDHEDFIVNVVTNHETGYDLTVAGVNLDGNTETINISQMQIGLANGALAAFTSENTDLSLTSTTTRTDAAGDDHALDARLTLPFVNSGLYQGTLTFTATTH